MPGAAAPRFVQFDADEDNPLAKDVRTATEQLVDNTVALSSFMLIRGTGRSETTSGDEPTKFVRFIFVGAVRPHGRLFIALRAR